MIGHFEIGDPGTAGLALAADARQFAVLEGKLFNRFSAGVRNAPFFDQAGGGASPAMAETLRRASADPAGGSTNFRS